MKLAGQWWNQQVEGGSYDDVYDRASGINPGKPLPEHPMQQISICAAMYFARLAGCRLPTLAEWQAAYEASPKPAEKPLWNLRDRTWAMEFDFARNLRSNSKLTDLP